MGFDVDRFEGTVNDGLLCCICRDVLEDPVQAPCEHAFCSTCIAAWLVHDSICPEDRQTLLDTDLRPLFRYMKNDLDRMRLWCKNRSRGCDHMCNLEFIKRHEAECPFESVVCPNPGCGTHINRRDLREHLMQCQHMVLAATPARRSSKSTSQHELLATIDDLRTQLDLFKVDMECKLDDQKQEMDLRLDAQRRHLVQRESSLQLQIDEIRTQNCRLQQVSCEARTLDTRISIKTHHGQSQRKY